MTYELPLKKFILSPEALSVKDMQKASKILVMKERAARVVGIEYSIRKLSNSIRILEVIRHMLLHFEAYQSQR
jgi:hypothetical protein